MQITKNIEVFKKSLVMAVVLGLVFFAGVVQFANAEEEPTTGATEESAGDVAEKRAAMKAQIESLRKLVEERKAQLQEKREGLKEDRQETIADWKAKQASDRAAFMSSLEGLTPEEKKTAILEYVNKLKASVEAKKAEMKANKDALVAEVKEKKVERVEDREAFRSSLEGMTKEEKYAAIMARVAALKAQLEARLANGDDDDVEEETEDSEDEEDETEEEDDGDAE